jgi:hypothetical protein
MSRPAYLVEGVLEQRFVQNVCPNAPVRLINCNGHSVSIEAIAKRLGTLGRLLHKRHSPLIVVIDREAREEAAADFKKALAEAMLRENIEVPILIGVPDRNVECWILADFERFVESAGLDAPAEPAEFDGCNGKSAIKKLLSEGSPYVETIHGVAWLKAARPEIMADNSPSFLSFLKEIGHIRCWWISQAELSLSGHEQNLAKSAPANAARGE